jgi:hypothetical protein
VRFDLRLPVAMTSRASRNAPEVPKSFPADASHARQCKDPVICVSHPALGQHRTQPTHRPHPNSGTSDRHTTCCRLHVRDMTSRSRRRNDPQMWRVDASQCRGSALLSRSIVALAAFRGEWWRWFLRPFGIVVKSR